ncbi:FERM domain-containing protein 8 [Trichinella zimbabwensis]|uniref:FERM domain-containing protein 8 n=1 Tax=Trichinella zimbabwensis TaxID=268475 RepID=A0A0V1HE52_9BILA|nr:FERM domain-containing protein 8 [Trichinella zimbabwensis]
MITVKVNPPMRKAEKIVQQRVDYLNLSLTELNMMGRNDNLSSPVTETVIDARNSSLWEKMEDFPLDICIYLPDHRGIQFSVAGGRHASAEQLANLVFDEIGLEKSSAEEALTLWMCSPLLSIQLKAHHVPFQIRKLWMHFLRRYSHGLEEEMTSDEPLLILQRNVLLTMQRQRQVITFKLTFPIYSMIKKCYIENLTAQLQEQHESLLEILYLHAKESILNGHCPCPMDLCLRLASLQMAVEWRSFNSSQHTATTLRESLENFLPAHVLTSVRSWSLFGWTIPFFKGSEDRLLSLYKAVAEWSKFRLYNAYIDLCMKLPSYGAAVFAAELEMRSRWRMHYRLSVYASISRCWISVWEASGNKSHLFTVALGHCQFWLLDDDLDQFEDNYPALLLMFAEKQNDDGPKLLVTLFSKQAPLMEALLNSFCTEQQTAADDQVAIECENELAFQNRLSQISAVRFYNYEELRTKIPIYLKSRLERKLNIHRDSSNESF